MHNVRWENTTAFDPARAPAPTRRGNGNAGPYQCFSGLRTGLLSPRLLSISFSRTGAEKRAESRTLVPAKQFCEPLLDLTANFPSQAGAAVSSSAP